MADIDARPNEDRRERLGRIAFRAWRRGQRLLPSREQRARIDLVRHQGQIAPDPRVKPRQRHPTFVIGGPGGGSIVHGNAAEGRDEPAQHVRRARQVGDDRLARILAGQPGADTPRPGIILAGSPDRHGRGQMEGQRGRQSGQPPLLALDLHGRAGPPRQPHD